ncbi:MAG: hypothetical protein MJ250_03365 [Alphaproteobacteria bacterium]|nr:hypothetical protein [Alphaproteobacteria bacterium]
MKKSTLFFACLIVMMTSDCFSKSARLGESQSRFSHVKKAVRQIPCETNDECPFGKECVASICIEICTKNLCSEGKYCLPTKTHNYRCVNCLRNNHCPDKLECNKKTYECEQPDPCKKAICSPGAPFCIPEPYQSLPYTCVQCTSDEHCPPIGGVVRHCIQNFCLFEGQSAPAVVAPPSALDNDEDNEDEMELEE